MSPSRLDPLQPLLSQIFQGVLGIAGEHQLIKTTGLVRFIQAVEVNVPSE